MSKGGLLPHVLTAFSGGRVLDVATGHGDFAFALARNLASYDEIIGIDTNDKELETARETAKQQSLTKVRFFARDAEVLGFEDASFDTVTISNSLHHLKSPGTVLGNMRRVLRPGGLFIVREMYRDMQNMAQMSHVLFHTFRADIDTLKGITHRRSYLRDELYQMYQGLGLSATEVFDVGPEDIEPPIDPMDKDNIDHLVQMVDTMLEHPADYNHDQAFKVRGEELKAHFRANGFLPATALVVIGRKPG
jgi:ubiquinone/menaquinone biosynthesis C-methylase UbiE